MKHVIKNKKGWLKIAEAFVAILLIAGIVLIVINRGSNQQSEDASSLVKDVETGILRKVQLNEALRTEILGTSGEVNWAMFPTQAPNTKATIENNIPAYLSCEAKICNPSGPCSLAGTQNKNIYVESAMITSTLSTFKPRMLKLSCLEK